MFLPQLYTITSYSLLQSTIRINEYVREAKKLGYQTLAITDKDVLSGAAEFYRICMSEKIQPIIGLNLTYQFQERHYELLLYAKDRIGYQQLIKLSSKKMIREKIELHEIDELDHLLVVLPTKKSIADDYGVSASFDSHWQSLQEKIASSHLYVGVTEETPLEAPEWLAYLRANQFQLCAVHPIASLHQEELFSLETMKHLREGTQLSFDEVRQTTRDSATGFLLPEAELRQRFINAGLEEALNNAQQLAKTVTFEFQFHQKLLPHYPVPENRSAGEYLQELCQKQLGKRVEKITAAYQERLDYELSVIHQMGFDDYFLIVWDVMAFAHKNNIVTGAGRGSAAGSLVAYVLEITDVDPLEYDLLFERFLNPERYTMPDIDLDIPDNRREEVLIYVREKYGQYHMAQIATFGTMAAKMVLRDVARVFGLSQSEANRWSKAIPNQLKMTLNEAYRTSNKLVELVQASEKNQLLLVVEDILQKWSRVGKPIIFEKDIHVLLPQLVSNETKKVLWLVSNSGNSKEVVMIGQLAKEMGIDIIALTQFGNNRLSKLADVVVQTSRPKEITNRSAATNSLLAQFATIDIIFYLYMAKNEKLTEKVTQTKEVIKNYVKQK